MKISHLARHEQHVRRHALDCQAALASFHRKLSAASEFMEAQSAEIKARSFGELSSARARLLSAGSGLRELGLRPDHAALLAACA